MPVYEYECKDCLTGFEVKRSMKDSDKGGLKCPDCGSANTRRVYSLFGWKMSSTGSSLPSTGSCFTLPGRSG